MSKPFVAILMGSDSDWPVLQASAEVLKQMQVPHEVRVHSAHRTPAETHAYVKDADTRGCGVFIAAAGMAAHLAGTVAALTLKPVIGVPLSGGILDGLDSLLSTVQMPGGIPVATVAVGKAGAKNAAYLACQILALSDVELAKRVRAEREANSQQVLARNVALQKDIKS
ncbi:MAG: 5-(carboxyamino)imidazole ribonucleotide mutase [Nevskiales bacterium]